MRWGEDIYFKNVQWLVRTDLPKRIDAAASSEHISQKLLFLAFRSLFFLFFSGNGGDLFSSGDSDPSSRECQGAAEREQGDETSAGKGLE